MNLLIRYCESLLMVIFIVGLILLAGYTNESNALTSPPFTPSPSNYNSKKTNNTDCQQQQIELQKLLNKAVKQGLPGVVLGLYQPQCGSTQLASGRTNLANGTAMSVQDHFRIASCSKVFLGVVVMQLVSEGRISLSDPIAKYIPAQDASKIKNANRATIRQLMNHTSGIYDYFDDQFIKDAANYPNKRYTLLETLKYAYGKPAAFSPPGSDYSYSNTDTILLALMVEKVTQAPFTQALRQRIFNPLHLTNTYNDYADRVIAPLAHGYVIDKGEEPIDYTNINQGYGLPDGGIVSTADNMVIFIRSLLHDNKLLRSDALKTMLTIDDAASDAQEGLNIFSYEDYLDGKYGKLIGHDGEIYGYKSYMYYFPDYDVSIVLLTNSSGDITDKYWDKLFDNVTRTVFNSKHRSN